MPSPIMSCEGKLIRTSYFLSNGSIPKVDDTYVNKIIEEFCDTDIISDKTTGHLSAILSLIKKFVKHDWHKDTLTLVQVKNASYF